MKHSLFALAPAAIGVVIAGCGGGGTGNAHSAAASTPTSAGAPAAPAADVGLQTTKLGKFLADSHGRTLYLFEKDTGTASTCYGACASIWPPFTVKGTPTGGTGVVSAKLGTTKRTDGQTEVTYNGHPLYYYAPDASPGQTQGQGLNQFGAPWYVVAANGVKIDNGS